MPRLDVPSISRAWPRACLFTLIAVTATGCAGSARFDSNPYASNYRQPPAPEATGSIAQRPAASKQVYTQPLPAPSRPATVASSGVASGAQGLGAYRPSNVDYTGSVPARRAPTPLPPTPPAGHWTWDGGSPVTVGRNDTVESIAHRHGVPASAIMQTNGIRNAASIRPGQRLVIPRYVSTARHAPPPPAPRVATPRKVEASVHIVEPGETLIGIARRHRVTLKALARANNIKPYTKVAIGDRLTIPGGRQVASRHEPAPKIERPRTVAPERVSSIPQQTARIAKPEVHAPKSATKTAEATGGLPSFRWPVRGRVIAGFGARPNGTQNDGINLAVPEGTPIKAADDGVVAYAGNELKGYGNLVLIRHSGGYVSAYANASELMVKRGETVKRGQVIARAGQTGNVTSPQLHFEIRKGSRPVDPMHFLGGA